MQNVTHFNGASIIHSFLGQCDINENPYEASSGLDLLMVLQNLIRNQFFAKDHFQNPKVDNDQHLSVE